MRKKSRAKLLLNRETLTRLDSLSLRRALGACESDDGACEERICPSEDGTCVPDVPTLCLNTCSCPVSVRC